MAGKSKFAQSIADEICRRIEAGETLRRIAKAEGMPCVQTIMKWLDQNPSFVEQYTRAKEIQAENMAEEILEICDDGSNDWMEREADAGNITVLNGEHIQRSRLRVDTRKWLLSKMMPKKYGDKIDATVSGNITVQIVRFSDHPVTE